jgi:hypothetical protein
VKIRLFGLAETSIWVRSANGRDVDGLGQTKHLKLTFLWKWDRSISANFNETAPGV